jgi:hypothetical protein
MFDDVSDAGLIDGIGAASRAESAAMARRLALIGELDARRAVELVERRWWRVDPFLEVAAEVAAALNISRSRVGDQIHLARVLRDELPAVAAVFATGAIDYRMVDTIISRTDNVELDRKPAVDAAIARHCVKWMRLSKPKLRDRVDLWVAKHDPAAVRVPPKVDDGRYIEVGETSAGMAGIWANVRSSDAAVFDRRLEALAATVCDLDPRTKQQRRSDALGPLGRRGDTLACQCGSPDCAAGAERTAVGEIVIHVLAEQATVVGTSDQPGYLPGFGILPAESVRDLAQTATVKPLAMPDGAEPGYRPSATLAQFVRFRDVTCRFPGCDAPAQVCDVDHTAPYPDGPTHPSNTKLYCRTEHRGVVVRFRHDHHHLGYRQEQARAEPEQEAVHLLLDRHHGGDRRFRCHLPVDAEPGAAVPADRRNPNLPVQAGGCCRVPQGLRAPAPGPSGGAVDPQADGVGPRGVTAVTARTTGAGATTETP